MITGGSRPLPLPGSCALKDREDFLPRKDFLVADVSGADSVPDFLLFVEDLFRNFENLDGVGGTWDMLLSSEIESPPRFTLLTPPLLLDCIHSLGFSDAKASMGINSL